MQLLGGMLVMSSLNFPSAQGGRLFPALREQGGWTQEPRCGGAID